MKLLTRKTDYAVRALVVLSQEKEKFISAREISRRQSIPYQFLRGVLQKLADEGIVEAKEGNKGGFRIAKDPADISVEELIYIFQGQIKLSECMFRKKICSNRKTCPLRREISRIEKIVSSEFSEITIARLIKI